MEDIIYKLRNDLEVFKSKELESTFIEMINQKRKHILVIGCILRHPGMGPNNLMIIS